MRRTKEDMLITRRKILDSGLDCFSEKGFEATSLVEVASRAGVTRGAIYWHFENKLDLYRSVVDYTLEQGNIAAYFESLPVDMPLKERLNEVFWSALGENKYVDFVFKTMSYIYGRDEFTDIYDKLVKIKRSLYDTLKMEINLHIRMNNLADKDPALVAKTAYLYFEGMFLTKNIPVGLEITRREIEEFTTFVMNMLE